MAWTKKGIKGNKLFDFNNKTPGTSVEGVYKGVRHVEKTDSNMHTIEVNGELLDFWGSGGLDYKLGDVAAETKIKVTYNGKVKAEVVIKGKKVKKEINDYDVEVWSE